jgi:predicted ester cyclase
LTADGLPAVLTRMLDLWNGANVDPATVYAPVCSENGTSTFTPEDIVGDVARLRAGLGDLHFQVDGWAAAADWYLLRMSAEGAHRGELLTPLGVAAPTGKRLRLSGLEAFQIHGDRIVAVWLAWNWSDAYRALGATLGDGAGAANPD